MKSERIFYSLILFLICSIILNNLKTRISYPYLNNDQEANRFWVVKTLIQKNYDIILMGDSRVYRGISPSTIEQSVPGVRILNFAYSSGGLNRYMYEEAYNKLDPNSSRKAIIIGLSAYALSEFESTNAAYITEKTRSIDYIVSNYLLPGAEYFISPINNILSDYLTSRMTAGNIRRYYQEFYDDGWVASRATPDDPTLLLGSYRRTFKTRKVSTELIKQLADHTASWKKNNITVFAFRMPTARKMAVLENQSGGFNEELISKEFEKSGGIWLDFSKGAYHSYDGSHLDKDSAVKFSQDLAGKIDEYMNMSK
jgi:hypothetical protein